MKQKDLAKEANVTDSMISQILAGKKRPSWATSKLLGKASGTKPELWLDGSPSEIKQALKENQNAKDIISDC